MSIRKALAGPVISPELPTLDLTGPDLPTLALPRNVISPESFVISAA